MIHDFPTWYPEYLPGKLKTHAKKPRQTYENAEGLIHLSIMDLYENA